jgi:hypothetical protein
MIAARAQRQAQRRNFRHNYKVADILVYSWGHNQTNVQFYQVVGRTASTVSLREIARKTVPGSDEGRGSACVVALPGHFLENGKLLAKRVQASTTEPEGYISMPHGLLSRWNGEPRHCSWYA